jgi:predicted amidohydrolase YtcJ
VKTPETHPRCAAIPALLVPLLVAPLGACRSPVPPAAGAPTRAAGGGPLCLVGGVIYGADGGSDRPATALCADGGRILTVGSDPEVAARAPKGARTIELKGGAVLVALTDAHAHLLGLGLSLERADLRQCASAEACAARAAEAARARPAGQWIEGRGWDQNRFADRAFPSHDPLDRALGDRPAFLRRVDGHAGWASARALALAGITRATADPAGGRIVRDGRGEPTGVLVDAAMDLVERVIPPPTQKERERAILRAEALALAAGLTEVHEMGIDEETVEVYRALDRAGRLRLRVYAMAAGDSATALDKLFARRPDPHGGPSGARDPRARFVLAGVKLYADGALGSRGAALLEPYADDPGNRGLTITDEPALEAAARRARATGWQVAVHAIGDRGNRAVLDAYERAGVVASDRFRIEHAQVVAVADLPRFARLGVVASMQPTHATSDMPWAEARVGKERIQGAYAWRTLLTLGAHLAFGSDFPVEDVDPIGGGLYAAVTRMDKRGQPAGGWRPEERLSLAEAVAAFSRGAAYAAFEEAFRGRAAVGQLADLTVLDRDLVGGPAALLTAQVRYTIIGGEIVYQRDQTRETGSLLH